MESSDNNFPSTHQFDHLLHPHAHTHVHTQWERLSPQGSGCWFLSPLICGCIVGLAHTWYHCILLTGLCQEQKTEQRTSDILSRLPGAGMFNIRTVPYESPGGGPSRVGAWACWSLLSREDVCREAGSSVLTLAPTLTCLVNLDELLHLSESQFLHLGKGA